LFVTFIVSSRFEDKKPAGSRRQTGQAELALLPA
jgi:hypothetical protein